MRHTSALQRHPGLAVQHVVSVVPASDHNCKYRERGATPLAGGHLGASNPKTYILAIAVATDAILGHSMSQIVIVLTQPMIYLHRVPTESQDVALNMTQHYTAT